MTKVHCSLWQLQTSRTVVYPHPDTQLTGFTFSTDAHVREYVSETYMKGAPDAEVERVLNFYPDGRQHIPAR